MQHALYDHVAHGLVIKNKTVGGVAVQPKTGVLAVKSRVGLRVLGAQ
jgi:hypothetical protein